MHKLLQLGDVFLQILRILAVPVTCEEFSNSNRIFSGVQIDFNCEAVDVDVKKGTVKLATGEVLKADVIVGADGATSIVRERMVGRKENSQAGPFTGYT